jgi:hypothetical protein
VAVYQLRDGSQWHDGVCADEMFVQIVVKPCASRKSIHALKLRRQRKARSTWKAVLLLWRELQCSYE